MEAYTHVYCCVSIYKHIYWAIQLILLEYVQMKDCHMADVTTNS